MLAFYHKKPDHHCLGRSPYILTQLLRSVRSSSLGQDRSRSSTEAMLRSGCSLPLEGTGWAGCRLVWCSPHVQGLQQGEGVGCQDGGHCVVLGAGARRGWKIILLVTEDLELGSKKLCFFSFGLL